MAEYHDEHLQKFLAGLSDTVEKFEHWHTNTENRNLVPEGQRPCPICSQPMRTGREHGVQIDVCPDHGIWLDGNELAGILANYKDSPIQEMRLRNEYERGFRDGCRTARWP